MFHTARMESKACNLECGRQERIDGVDGVELNTQMSDNITTGVA